MSTVMMTRKSVVDTQIRLKEEVEKRDKIIIELTPPAKTPAQPPLTPSPPSDFAPLPPAKIIAAKKNLATTAAHPPLPPSPPSNPPPPPSPPPPAPSCSSSSTPRPPSPTPAPKVHFFYKHNFGCIVHPTILPPPPLQPAVSGLQGG